MTDPPSPGLSLGAETAIRPAGHEARGQPKPISRIPDKRPGAAKERRPMPYDPDLDPVFDELRSAQAELWHTPCGLGKAPAGGLDAAERPASGRPRPADRAGSPLPPAAPSPAPDPIWSMNEGYHSWACAIVYHADPRRAEVTFFFDDVEVGCHVLHARHEDMKTRLELFPIANVAVKASSSYTPEQYNTDDGRGHSGDMLIRDIAYYPAGFAMPPLAK